VAKLVWLLILAILAWRLFFGFWPWDHLIKDSRAARLGRARRLLGLRKNATRDDIIQAHRKRVAQVHPDRGGRAELVYEADAARDLLLAENRNSEKE